VTEKSAANRGAVGRSIAYIAIAAACVFLGGAFLANAFGADVPPEFAKFAGAVAWPVVAFAALLVLRLPLGTFLQALGERATKVSFLNVDVELGSAEAKPGPIADLAGLSKTMNPDRFTGDSSNALFAAVGVNDQADYSVIDLGNGTEWLTSRLFIAASLLPRMRGERCFVFVESRDGVEQRFLRILSVQRIRWRLAQECPWLEIAFAAAYADTFRRPYQIDDQLEMPKPLEAQGNVPVIHSEDGALYPYAAQKLTAVYLKLLQQPPGSAGVKSTDEWTELDDEREERGTWITRELLFRIFGMDGVHASVVADPPTEEGDLVMKILRVQAPFVALVDSKDRFLRLIDRGELLKELGQRAARLPSSRSS